MSERSTDLNQIRQGHPFTWGETIQLHVVGDEYVIVEFHPWQKYGCLILTGQPNKNEFEFFGWVHKKPTGCTWNSLDAAIVGCIALKHEGLNGRAASYFMKMISQ